MSSAKDRECIAVVLLCRQWLSRNHCSSAPADVFKSQAFNTRCHAGTCRGSLGSCLQYRSGPLHSKTACAVQREGLGAAFLH